jgi:hypothetical protein
MPGALPALGRMSITALENLREGALHANSSAASPLYYKATPERDGKSRKHDAF